MHRSPSEKMAESGGGDEILPKKSVPDREERIRVLRERQADERLRRLEDLKKQALEAQQLREQKEAERRRRMEDLRLKENERRSQVEGRKKMINEAEQERREAILRKNQERDARLNAKRRNERSSIVFAFGSSTPRLLETYDSMYASYWGPRRATSTANLRLFPAGAPLSTVNNDASSGSRRPSEREQEGKKRAASAGGLYRTPTDKMATSMYEVLHWCSEPDPHKPPPSPNSGRPGVDVDDGGMAHVGRRKTDLMPTTPLPKDPSSRPGSGSRSLSRTPGRAVSMARLDQLAQPRTHLSRSTAHLADPGPLRAAKSMVALGRAQTTVAPPSRTTRAERLRQRARAVAAARSPTSDGASSSGDVTPSRPSSVMSQSSVLTSSTFTPRLRSIPKRPRPSSIHVTGVSKDKILSPSEDSPKPKAPPKPAVAKKINQQKNEEIKKQQLHKVEPKSDRAVVQDESSGKNVKKVAVVNSKKKEPTKVNGTVEKEVVVNGVGKDETAASAATAEAVTPPEKVDVPVKEESTVESMAREDNLLVDVSGFNEVKETETAEISPAAAEPVQVAAVSNSTEASEVNAPLVDLREEQKPVIVDSTPAAPVVDPDSTADLTNKDNVMTRSRMITEEEAKAKLAERRRLAREQAEREAEAERQRLAREAEEEAERMRIEEEQQRLAEEEQLRMIEEARKVEQQRLMLAIQEAQKREEEEKERLRLEEKARLEKEEADRLAREEAERQRQELAERLKKEEEERQARRKRVEAIMKRTRNAPAANSKPDSEKGEQDGAEHEKDESKGSLEAFLHGERVSSDRNLTNGQSSQKPPSSNINDENHLNGLSQSEIANEDCVNSNQPALSTPLIAFQGKAMETPLPADFLA